jgi:hypothetical protein
VSEWQAFRCCLSGICSLEKERRALSHRKFKCGLHCIIQGEHEVFPWLQTYITRKLCGIQTSFFKPLLKLVSKILCYMFIVTFGFWMQHFQTGGLGGTVRHPGHHDRRKSPPLDFILWGYVRTECFWHQFQILQIWKARKTHFCYNNWRHVAGYVERSWLSIRRSPCNKRSTCWNVLMCCEKKNSELHVKKNKFVFHLQ